MFTEIDRYAKAAYDVMVQRTAARGEDWLSAWDKQPESLREDWRRAVDEALKTAFRSATQLTAHDIDRMKEAQKHERPL